MSIKTRLDKLEAQNSAKTTTTPTTKLIPELSAAAWMFLFQPGFDGELTAEQMAEVDAHNKWMAQHGRA